MNTRKLLLPVFAALFGLAVSAFGQTQTTEATVARVTGAATVTMPDGSTAPLTAGMKVAQGSTITTGADGDVFLESHAGYVTAIKHDSVVAVTEISVTTEGGKVKEEKTLLDLKSGNLVAKLDPTKKAVNNYQVRTPKGVAAARGTVFTVTYNNQIYAITTISGTVSVSGPNGYQASVGAGMANVLVPGKVASYSGTIADAMSGLEQYGVNSNDRDQLNNILAMAVATVAVAAQNNIGGTTKEEAAAVAKAILTSAPAVAEQAGALIKQSTPAGQDNSAVLDAIKAVTPPAALDALSKGASTGTFTSAPSTPTTTPNAPTSTPPPPATTPQPIDPSTVSRSG